MIGRAIKATGRGSRAFGRDLLQSVPTVGRRAGSWGVNHPKSVIGGAAVGAAIAARPFKGGGSMAQEELLGSPNAIATMSGAYAQDAWESHFDTDYEVQNLTNLNARHGRYSAVDGSLVMGLYNKRMGG